MYQIIPRLYLSAYGAVDISQLDEKNERRVFIVNCTKNLPMLHENGMRIDVDDDKSSECIETMFSVFPHVVGEIHEQLEAGNTVIVHCLAGQQRSPAVIVAYLMIKCGYEMSAAIEYVRSKKPDAFFWSVNFQEALHKLDRALHYIE